ncbi:10581_t:CDS:2 [Rhizophagus irregularis]|nr:10581_t:CDS:2 [Rhizophagus irregularis]
MHQVFELIIRGKVSLLTEADPTAFNDPCDDKYRDTFKDRVKQKIILRSSTGILLPYGFKCGRYVVGIVVKVSSFDKSIEHKQIRGNSVSSSVNKLIEHRQTGSQEKLPPCHQSIN